MANYLLDQMISHRIYMSFLTIPLSHSFMQFLYLNFALLMSAVMGRLAGILPYLLILTVITCVSLWILSSFRPFSGFLHQQIFNELSKFPKDDLARALEGASMGNKTLIISVLNRAYATKNGMLDLFLEGFHVGQNTSSLVNHLLLVTVDQTSFDRCNLLHRHCYKLVTESVDFSKEVLFMSEDFIRMMWRRTLFLGEVLKRGYNFVFSDMDVLWLRDPFKMLSHEDDDIQISCDKYLGNPYDESNPLNTGFYHVVSNNKTIALFDEWYDARNRSAGKKEQDVLVDMKNSGVFGSLKLKVRFLDVFYFGGFCENSGNFSHVRTLHANCCRSIKAKLGDLTLVIDEWKRYVNGTLVKFTWPQRKACENSWKENLQ